jgi:hypothetical protein
MAGRLLLAVPVSAADTVPLAAKCAHLSFPPCDDIVTHLICVCAVYVRPHANMSRTLESGVRVGR